MHLSWPGSPARIPNARSPRATKDLKPQVVAVIVSEIVEEVDDNKVSGTVPETEKGDWYSGGEYRV
jgi:hypothetical protein